MVASKDEYDERYIAELEDAINAAVSEIFQLQLELAESKHEVANLRKYIEMKGGLCE